MLKLTKKADYALIAVKHLAECGDPNSCSAKDIADAYGIPQAALAKIADLGRLETLVERLAQVETWPALMAEHLGDR